MLIHVHDIFTPHWHWSYTQVVPAFTVARARLYRCTRPLSPLLMPAFAFSRSTTTTALHAHFLPRCLTWRWATSTFSQLHFSRELTHSFNRVYSSYRCDQIIYRF